MPLPLALLLLACAAPVQGAPSDPLHVFAGLGYFHDDNLFRLPPAYPGFAERRSDSARYATAGLLFDKQRARQRVKLEGKLSKIKFAHFNQLDYDAKDLLVLLNWQVVNHRTRGASSRDCRASIRRPRARPICCGWPTCAR